ncbi:MAG: tetrapyrrole methylase [Planctomycetota bacterium]|nr:MAG: tetrapyrrole methylase [Planctomycetota bacterium]
MVASIDRQAVIRRWGILPLLVVLVFWQWQAGTCTAHPHHEHTATQSLYYLVGVGPGDADLITLRALRVIERADVVFVSPGVKERFAEQLEGKKVVEGFWRLFPYYGRQRDEVPADEREAFDAISAKRNTFIKLVREATAEGKVVAVLDSGDPLIYGPWAWSLREFADLHPVVIPGVSCFNAANAALACPIQDGTETKSIILTADDWPGKKDTIDKLAKLNTTMVLFTMRADFDTFIDKLLQSRPPETPVAIVEYAGFADREAVIVGTLGTIRQKVSKEKLPFEYLIYVGDFLRLRAPAETDQLGNAR